jgi:hypothetical protein
MLLSDEMKMKRGNVVKNEIEDRIDIQNIMD